jgi:hypothetical protein
MQNEELNINSNTEFSNNAMNSNMENDSSCCGGSSPCCIEDEVTSTYESKAEPVKVAEPVMEKASGGCGCNCGCN